MLFMYPFCKWLSGHSKCDALNRFLRACPEYHSGRLALFLNNPKQSNILYQHFLLTVLSVHSFKPLSSNELVWTQPLQSSEDVAVRWYVKRSIQTLYTIFYDTQSFDWLISKRTFRQMSNCSFSSQFLHLLECSFHFGCGSQIWTDDLRVMSPTSYRAAPSRDIYCLLMATSIVYHSFRRMSIRFLKNNVFLSC